MVESLVIVGGGGFAREAAWIALQQPERWKLRGFLDDRSEAQGHALLGAPVLGPISAHAKYSDSKFCIAIGAPHIRKKVRHMLSSIPDSQFAKLIDPSAKFHRTVEVGFGAIVCAGVVATVNISAGKHLILNLNTTVGHDCVFGDYCTVAPLSAISGHVTCENCVEIGTGAAIRQGITLSEGCLVGMGAVVVSNVERHSIVVGNPAKKIRELTHSS